MNFGRCRQKIGRKNSTLTKYPNLFKKEACLINFSRLVDMFCKPGISRSTQVVNIRRQRKVWIIRGKERRMLEPIARIISTVEYFSSSLLTIGW